MTRTPLVDTTIHEPSPTAGETEMMMFALERVRGQFAWKCGGLDAAGLDRRHPPSTMTLGGPLKRMALLENGVIARDLSGEHPTPRRALIDLVEEYLRHTGHADLLREAHDGLVGNDPPRAR